MLQHPSLFRKRREFVEVDPVQGPRLFRGLIIGDGDGRFGLELLESQPEIIVDSVDISQAMLQCAQDRIGRQAPQHLDRYQPHLADALEFESPADQYDLIVLHFALDCFTQQEIDLLLPRLAVSHRAGGHLLYSDFQIPERPLANRVFAQCLVGSLYFAFKISAGIKPWKLPQVEWNREHSLLAETVQLRGSLISQLWQRRCGKPA